MEHYRETGYPLAVKLGTITAEGKGDVFSYAEDEMVEDPFLADHLKHFGINVQQLQKVIEFLNLESFIIYLFSVLFKKKNELGYKVLLFQSLSFNPLRAILSPLNLRPLRLNSKYIISIT